MPSTQCPKCGNHMEEGFVRDSTHGATLQSSWVEGKPQRSFWTGVKVNKDDMHAITTYRCLRCGFLESYAI